MSDKANLIKLVADAQDGDQASFEQLAEVAQERLRVYVYRLTLRDDVAQDIVQETMLEMFKVLGKLKDVERFWSWLYGIAHNKLRRHYRTANRQKAVPIEDIDHARLTKDSKEGLEKLVGEELKRTVVSAMSGLKQRHRAVLTMRCYDQMKYSQIAETLGCSEFGARMLFLRAKRALGSKLAKKGLGKGSVLTALIVFGQLTSDSQAVAAQISITGSILKVGIVAEIAGAVTSKAAVVVIATAGAVGGSTLVLDSNSKAINSTNDQFENETSVSITTLRNEDRMTENWYFFPKGTGEQVMIRFVECSTTGRPLYCRQLQNERANYFFDVNKNTVYINNHRAWRDDYSVWQLPTDGDELSEFIDRVQGQTVDLEGDNEGTKYVPMKGGGLLAICVNKDEKAESSTSYMRHRNLLSEDYFQYDWSDSTRVIDNRDTMHKRGWTYFTVSGQLNGKEVSGTGCVPFVYEASKSHLPWMRLRVGDKMYTNDGFAGLARPWMGLHAIDVVRRDAARQKIEFETRLNNNRDKSMVVLSLSDNELLYTIDMENDLIEKIAIRGTSTGLLEFSYMQDVSGAAGEFDTPAGNINTKRIQGDMSWLIGLAEGQLD